jgi:hypothetical protein
MSFSHEYVNRDTPELQRQRNRVETLYADTLSSLETPELRAFAARAVELILSLAQEIQTRTDLLPSVAELEDQLKLWIADKAHGVRHSYALYERSLELKAEELAKGNTQFDVDEEALELRAILHDFGEFIPVYDSSGQLFRKTTGDGRVDEAWQFRRHDQLIAIAVQRIGRALGIDDTQQLARALRHHDFYWSRPSEEASQKMKESLTPTDWLFIDADRLVGDSVSEQISRNRDNSMGKWYILRGDLSPEDRDEWQLRTGGLFDGSAALYREFSGEDYWFYTDAGKERNRQKRQDFLDSYREFYLSQYRSGWELIAQAREHHWPIEVGLRGEKDGNKSAIVQAPEAGVSLTSEMSDAELCEQFATLMSVAVTGKENPKFIDPNTGESRKYYGYSVRVNEKFWLDPSILRFADEAALEQALITSFDQYQEMITQKAKANKK